MRMEKNLSSYITKLIELDTKAVDFKGSRDTELEKLEADSRDELKSIEGILENTAIEARHEYDRIIKEARKQAEGINEEANVKIAEVQAYFEGIKDKAVRDIWEQLLRIER